MSSKQYQRGVDKFYQERDEFALGQTYCNHIQAMTTEELHSKSAIAAELAYRDIRIAELEAQLRDARFKNFELLQRICGGA